MHWFFLFLSFFLSFSFISSFLHLLTYIYIIAHSHSRQNLSCPLILQFCWRENISNNKKDIGFFAIWEKDSYTERFLALLPCTCVLQLTLVYLYQTSSLLPSHLPILASVSLRSLYMLLYGEQIKHFQVLVFLPFLYSSCVHSPFSVWPMSNNITIFVLGL
jgi:hypothetical protein